MDKKELKFLLSEGEGYNVEFKESYSDSIAKEMCAFANATGGKILLGVADNKAITGIEATNRLKSEIQTLARNIDPKLEIKIESTSNILIITIPEGKSKPYSVNGKFYIRNGPNSQQLARDEIRQFFISEGLIRFDEKTSPKFSIEDDISKPAFGNFLRLSKISRIINRKDILENLALLESGAIKNAGILLFCKRIIPFFPNATITCITFQGNERLKIVNRKEFDNDLLSNYENAMDFLKEKLNTEYIIRTGGPRVEKLELPEEALKEALLNAIGHRDYFKTASVFVEIYHDRVEITNPGGLVKGLRKEDLGTKSMPRNGLLFGLLQRMDLVEMAGTGIKRIQEAMKAYKLKNARISADEHWFTMIFDRPKDTYEERIYGNTTQITREKICGLGERLGERLGENQAKILKYIVKNKDISTRELSAKIGISTTAIENNISILKKKGIIKRIGPDRGGHWEVNVPK